MNNPYLKKILPHVIAIVIFIVIGIAYFSPVVEGYEIAQSDIIQHKGTNKEILDHREAYGEEPLWTNSLFGGMPTTQISTHYPTNFMVEVSRAFQLWLPSPLNFFFILMIGFYIMTQFLGVKPALGIVGSIAYALSCYFVIIIMVGHNTKVLALGYLPAMIGAVIYTYRNNKILLGTACTALFVALEFTSNHVQITYYGFFVLFFYAIVEFISFYKKQEVKQFFIKTAFIGAAFILGMMCAIGNLWGTLEYGKYTTRGGSEITITPDGKEASEDKTQGLDRSYITGWSYGVDETWNILIPNAKGGASAALFVNKQAIEDAGFTNEELAFMQIAYQRDGFVFSDYWGDQTTTAGPTYIGAVLIFLFILAFIFIDDPIKWALLAATVLTTMLAWGKNFPGLTNFFIDNFPMYSKFRTVSMMLVIAEMTIPLLAVLVLKKISEQKEILPKTKLKHFYIASGSLLGIILLLALMGGGSIVRSSESEKDYFVNYETRTQDFMKRVEASAAQAGGIEQLGGEVSAMYQYSQMFLQNKMANNIESKIMDYRKSVFKADAWRSFIFILLAAGILYLFFTQKINPTILIGGISLLIIVDLWMVDKRWVNNEFAKDRNDNVVKDDKGNPVYEMWAKKEQNQRPHVANGTDMKILSREVELNPKLNEMIAVKAQEFQNKKKESGDPNFQLTPEEASAIYFSVLTLNTNYRVLNTASRLDQDGRTSYFHKSLGGYHGAKLSRIQDLIDFHLDKEKQESRNALNGGTLPSIDSALKKLAVINMLNTKYIILDGNGDGDILDLKNPKMMKAAPVAMVNPHACGNAWFVSEIKWVKDANEEMLALDNFDPAKTVIIDEREKEKIGNLSLGIDESASVKMDVYKANQISYSAECSKDGLIVFSEIYYPDGWTCTVDGAETEIIRVNYLLRAIKVGKGKHKIEMVYAPKSYTTSKPISMIASLSVIGLILFALFKEYKSEKAAA